MRKEQIELQEKLTAMSRQIDLPFGQTAMALLYFSTLSMLMATLLLALIGVSEGAHIVSKSEPGLELRPFFRWSYHWRWVYGALAVLATLAPSLILYRVLKSVS